MAVMKELLIGQDEQRSNNPIDCTVVEALKATSVMDAIRMACANLGIDHDVAECIAAGTQARMHTVVGFADIEECIKSVLPGSHFTRACNAHPDAWPAPTRPTLAQAQEAAAAVAAQYGGHIEIHRYPNDAKTSDALGGVYINTCGICVTVYFFSEEAPPCTAS